MRRTFLILCAPLLTMNIANADPLKLSDSEMDMVTAGDVIVNGMQLSHLVFGDTSNTATIVAGGADHVLPPQVEGPPGGGVAKTEHWGVGIWMAGFASDGSGMSGDHIVLDFSNSQ